MARTPRARWRGTATAIFMAPRRGGLAGQQAGCSKSLLTGVETTLCVIPDDTMFPSPGQTQAGLVHGSDGNFYGATEYTLISGHGPYGSNTLFQVSANGAYTSLYSVDFPYSGFLNTFSPVLLVQGSDGSFYGTRLETWRTFGGAGTIFRLTIVPEFQAVTLTNSTLNLTWSTEAGATYQLQYNSDLSSSNWISLGSPSPPPERRSAPPTPSPTPRNGFTGWCSCSEDSPREMNVLAWRGELSLGSRGARPSRITVLPGGALPIRI
jgi:hypothetical protein